MNNSNNTSRPVMYTVTLVISDDVEITSKEVFATVEAAKEYIGREVVADDGTITVKGLYRINAV